MPIIDHPESDLKAVVKEPRESGSPSHLAEAMSDLHQWIRLAEDAVEALTSRVAPLLTPGDGCTAEALPQPPYADSDHTSELARVTQQVRDIHERLSSITSRLVS